MLLYKDRSWTCAETGKLGLSYQEALESERKAILKAEPKFPGVWIRPALEIIHGNKASLNDVIDEVYDYFRGTRFVTEQVFVDVPSTGSERSVEKSIILEKVANTVPVTLEKRPGDKRQIQREIREALEDKSRVPDDPHHYRIQLVNRPGKFYIVAPGQMRRPRQMLSKMTFKKYIKEVARKEGKWNGSPWIVKPTLVAKYGLAKEFPPDPNDPSNAEKDDGKKRKKMRIMDLTENPIEDTDLWVDPYRRKPAPETKTLPDRPTPEYNFGSVSEPLILPLIKTYNFLSIYSTPLRLYPFQFDNFIRHLTHTSSAYPSEVMCESFGSLLAVACAEYQNRFDSVSGINSAFHGVPKITADGVYSSTTEIHSAIALFHEIYTGFDIHEKVAVDQWFKWRPGQWGSGSGGNSSGGKLNTNTAMDHIKAWPVALFGLIKDCFPNMEGKEGLLKWNLLAKLVAPPPNDSNQEKDLMDVDGDGELGQGEDELRDEESGREERELESNDKERILEGTAIQGSEVDELEWEGEDETIASSKGRTTRGMASLPSEIVVGGGKKSSKKKSKVVKPAVMGFVELCTRMEKGFWNLSPDERVILLSFILEELVNDSKIVSSYRDESIEKVTELKKDLRDFARRRKAIALAITELDKAIENVGASVASVAIPLAIDLPIEFSIESEGSENDVEESNRPVRTTRLSRAKKILKVQEKLAGPEGVAAVQATATEFTEEQKRKQQEKQDLEAEDGQLQRRENVTDFELRHYQAAGRIKPLGKDRFCNRYWYFDAMHRSVSIEAITKVELDTTALKYEVKPDPDIPYDYSTGVLFVEEFGLFSERTRNIVNEIPEAVRFGEVDGKWGYYSGVEQIELLRKWLDVRGIRESHLDHNIEYYKDYIYNGIVKRTEVQKEQKAPGLFDQAFGYENWLHST